MYLLRDVNENDLPRLVELARVLDTLNLPHDEKALEQLIDLSMRSFTGRIRNPLERTYLFVLEDVRSGQIVGTSQIIAQHGTREAPHVYLEVSEREHYSAVLDTLFRHQVLRIGYNYEGFTEIGGLVVNPEWRRLGRPGKQLSFVRFLYIAMHRSRFRDRVLAELLPPLLPDGKSLLWEAFGARFTGIDYREADRLSRESKEFIQQLFPQGDVYVELLPQDVQQIIGQVGPNTEPVKRMLESVGFEFDNRIDPFDGGPHYSAQTGEVVPIREYRRAKLQPEPMERDWDQHLVGVERSTGNQRFRAVLSPCRLEDDKAFLPARTVELLGIEPGERVHTIPFEL